MAFSTQSEPDFQIFFQNWISQLELYLPQLLHHLDSLNQQLKHYDHDRLVRRVLVHYHEYFLAKAEVARRNVFLVLSPPWVTSYERTFLWLAGFRPGFVISVVKRCGIEFSSDQGEKIEKLTEITKNEEREITERLAGLERVAAPVVALARMGGREVNGVANEADTAVDRLGKSLEVLVECADCLRETTVAKVVAILTTVQTVRFLAAVVQVQLRIRRWGMVLEEETL